MLERRCLRMLLADLLPRSVMTCGRPLASPLDAPAVTDFFFHAVDLYSIDACGKKKPRTVSGLKFLSDDSRAQGGEARGLA